ncbi:MAG: ABC transporter permease [Thermomicrobiales bacterium]
MQPSVPAPSISIRSERRLKHEIRAVAASWRAKSLERLQWVGFGGYFLIWLALPVLQLAMTGLIYGDRPDLQRYAVVAIAASSLLLSAVFFAGEILDRERRGGTLPALFLAPCSRLSWLGGFQLAGLVEAIVISTVSLLLGRYGYGVTFDPHYPALAVTLVLFLAALWGMSMIFGAIGLLLKKANEFSNVVFPIALLLGGIYYPVAALPDWLRIPARALPLGYGFQALADAALDHAGFRDIAPQLLPLAAFALILPLAGMFTFRWLERLVRIRGELDLY